MGEGGRGNQQTQSSLVSVAFKHMNAGMNDKPCTTSLSATLCCGGAVVDQQHTQRKNTHTHTHTHTHNSQRLHTTDHMLSPCMPRVSHNTHRPMNAIITCHSQVCSGQAATQTHRQVTATSEALIPICPAAQLQQDAVTYMESLPPFGMLDRAALPVKQRSRLSDLTACESPGHVCIHSVSGGCKTSSACPATCLLLYVGLSVGCGCHTHESHGSLRCPPPVWCVECGVGTRAFLECSGVVTHTHTHTHAWRLGVRTDGAPGAAHQYSCRRPSLCLCCCLVACFRKCVLCPSV